MGLIERLRKEIESIMKKNTQGSNEDLTPFPMLNNTDVNKGTYRKDKLGRFELNKELVDLLFV